MDWDVPVQREIDYAGKRRTYIKRDFEFSEESGLERESYTPS